MCIPQYVLLTVFMVMNVIVKILTEYENWAVSNVTLCGVPKNTQLHSRILNVGVVCVLIILFSPSVLIGFHIANRFSGPILVTGVCRLLISPRVPINVVTRALL